jgi:hypothetical protein
VVRELASSPQNSNCHLQRLVPKIKALPGQTLAAMGVMALSHHELSVEIAVIPFSLSLPPNDSAACPATFEMEHFHR